jgi:hypothetical protein
VRNALTLSGGPASPAHLVVAPRVLAAVDAGVRAALATDAQSPAPAPAAAYEPLGDTCLARLALYHALLWYGARVASAATLRLARAASAGAPTPSAAVDDALNDAGLAVVLYRDYVGLRAAADACLQMHGGGDRGDRAGRGETAARAASFHARVARAVGAFDEPRYGGDGRRRATQEWWTEGGTRRVVATVDAATQTDDVVEGGGRRVLSETESD